MKDTLAFEAFYPHSPERVWRALTDPTALKRWLLPTDFRPRLGHKFHFAEPTGHGSHGPICCEVVELDAPHRLAYTWQSARDPEPTLVTWTLEPVDGGTCVHLEHRAPASFTGLAFRAEARVNWSLTLTNSLPTLLRLTAPTRHPGRIALLPVQAHSCSVRHFYNMSMSVRTGIRRCSADRPTARTPDTKRQIPNDFLGCKENVHVRHL